MALTTLLVLLHHQHAQDLSSLVSRQQQHDLSLSLSRFFLVSRSLYLLRKFLQSRYNMNSCVDAGSACAVYPTNIVAAADGMVDVVVEGPASQTSSDEVQTEVEYQQRQGEAPSDSQCHVQSLQVALQLLRLSLGSCSWSGLFLEAQSSMSRLAGSNITVNDYMSSRMRQAWCCKNKITRFRAMWQHASTRDNCQGSFFVSLTKKDSTSKSLSQSFANVSVLQDTRSSCSRTPRKHCPKLIFNVAKERERNLQAVLNILCKQQRHFS